MTTLLTYESNVDDSSYTAILSIVAVLSNLVIPADHRFTT